LDVSVPVSPALPVWPGDPEVAFDRTADVSAGDPYNLTVLHMGAHTGTHIDAPMHFLPEGAGVEAAPLDALVGPARVIDLPDRPSISASDLSSCGIRPGERLLLKTDNSRTAWHREPFRRDYVHLTADAAAYLASCRAKLIGIDYLSIADIDDPVPVHAALLGAGVWILEGLDLSSAGAGRQQMVCLPLALVGSEGAPARVILRSGRRLSFKRAR
jgi:arylformamidase